MRITSRGGSSRFTAPIFIVIALAVASLTAAGAAPLSQVGTASGHERQHHRVGYASRPTIPDQVEAGRLADGSIRIDWQYSNDNTDIAGYVVRRNGKQIAEVEAGTLTYVDERPGTPTGGTRSRPSTRAACGPTSPRPSVPGRTPSGRSPPRPRAGLHSRR